MEENKYKVYFDIDPQFFPAVNPDVMKKDPSLWKKFYPHDTFVRLIKEVVSVLSRQQNRNIWVDGAYGTGKSHAAITLKCLLDASADDTTEYFSDFNLDQDLLKKFLQVKSEGKILTVHRYASSSIKGDNDLFLAIQESIDQALTSAGITNAAQGAMKDAVVKYLSEDFNKQTFAILVNGPYSSLFGGQTVDDILNCLQTYTDVELRDLMRKIFKVANERQIKAFQLDDKGLCDWIRETISANGLKAIVFIWDEFTEYFNNNMASLTGFQTMLELSQTAPFCFIPVTHRSEALFSDTDAMKTKILGRFLRPVCTIELPENMAFQLMGKAMQKTKDESMKAEWNNDILPELIDRTTSSRQLVGKETKLTDKEMVNILPIHPYAASMLKHISSSFDSNQRSMFDFIKSDRGDDTQAFQWFINNYGPYDENPLLTIDMLWSFFYDMGKDSLAQNIRQVLDNYPRLCRNQLLEDEKRVLKAVLLFQAISMEVKDTVGLFMANEKNLNNAFDGSDIDSGHASHIADKLVRDKILYKKVVGKNEVYAVLVGEVDTEQIDKHKHKHETKTTTNLVNEGGLIDAIDLSSALKLRFKITYASAVDFELTAKKAINESHNQHKKIYMVVTFAKDRNEHLVLSQKIKNKIEENPEENVVYVDCGKSVFGEDAFETWVEYKAKADFYSGKDGEQSRQNSDYAANELNNWKTKIRNGEFVYYSNVCPGGETMPNIDALMDQLRIYNKNKYPHGLECYNVISNMWSLNAASQGAECGLKQDIVGTYRSSNVNTKLDLALSGAWNVPEYWKSSPSLNISIIKNAVEEEIGKKMKRDGRVSISDIYAVVSEEPFGFLPCNLTAFVLGFLLKEYYGGKFTWSDGTTSDELTLDKMKEMIAEVLKQENTPNPKYKQKYIVTMPAEVKAFLDTTCKAFGILKSQAGSVEAARERVRAKMKDLSFPIWTLDYVVEGESLSVSVEDVKNIIRLYALLANNDGNQTDSDIAVQIGKFSLAHEGLSDNLQKLLTAEKCTQGIKAYLDVYKDGELPQLANMVFDGGQYINVLRSKFNADAGRWLWSKNTAEDMIDTVILEYKVIVESNKLVDTSKNYREVLQAWGNKAGVIRLAYNAIKNDVGDLDVFLDNIFEICQTNKLQEQHKTAFLENMKLYGGKFVDFCNNQQKEIFKRVCDFELSGMNDSDKEKVFNALPNGCFCKDKTEYANLVAKLVEDQKKGLNSVKLKNLWREKTGTANPIEWSEKYRMPIFAMLSADDYDDCRKVFDTINAKNAEAKAITDAIVYLENAKFFGDLNDAAVRDVKFSKNILQDNAVILKDLNEVKDYLCQHLVLDPYRWYGHPSVKRALDNMADSKYSQEGYAIAFKKIDEMNAEDVKRYLKELIKNNKNVGMEIIKNN